MTDTDHRRLAGKRAVISGAGSGIGRAAARRFHAEGASVGLLDVDAAAIRAVAAELGDGPPALALPADVRDEAQVEAAISQAASAFGGLDTVVANAGFQHVAPIAEFDEDRWDGLLSLLLTSPFLLAKYGWDALAASGQGRFIAIASAHALAASPYKAGYVSAKHGVLGLVRTLALEGAEHDLTATAVCPGFVRTPLVEAQIPGQAKAHGMDEDEVLEKVILAPHVLKRLIEPEEVAGAVLFLLGPSGGAFTGAPLIMDAGWTAR
jgi:3-hydroxybutyrate dehydrogenase